MCYLCNVVRLLFRTEYGIKCRRLKANVSHRIECNVIYGREYSKFMINIILSAANVSKLTEVRERDISCISPIASPEQHEKVMRKISRNRGHTHTQDKMKQKGNGNSASQQ